jgi:hypothetical protein
MFRFTKNHINFNEEQLFCSIIEDNNKMETNIFKIKRIFNFEFLQVVLCVE